MKVYNKKTKIHGEFICALSLIKTIMLTVTSVTSYIKFLYYLKWIPYWISEMSIFSLCQSLISNVSVSVLVAHLFFSSCVCAGGGGRGVCVGVRLCARGLNLLNPWTFLSCVEFFCKFQTQHWLPLIIR